MKPEERRGEERRGGPVRSRCPQLSPTTTAPGVPPHTLGARLDSFLLFLPPFFFFPHLACNCRGPMAVQAHYHHHHHHQQQHQPPPLFLARGVVVSPETTRPAGMEYHYQQHQQPPLFLDFSHGDGDGGNSRKRPREADAAAAMVAAPPPQMLSLQPQAQAQGHKVVSLAQLHNKRPPAATGLRLDFDDGGSEHVSTTTTSSASSLLSDELATQFDRCKNEMARMFQDHTERLRRALGEVRRRHYRSLLGAAEAAAARRMREKEAEASNAARRGAELEEHVARLRAEAAAWQAKALADQSTAAALHAQLQQAAAAAAQARGSKSPEDDDNINPNAAAADDAESGFVDPDRVEEVTPPPPPSRPCRTCRARPSSVVLLPCRHLCVCEACEPAVSTAIAAACPTCRGAVTGTVQVFIS
uniref:RING-type domain-containing protein n=1 Tax=Oryza glumipatula TaxID=40148 RepID=A0A0E0BDW3_9ORYZ